jgi:hypothetical protein
VLNTRPWVVDVHGDTVTVSADPSVRLAAIDPHGREMMISCGAALLNARLALNHCGRDPVVVSFPEPDTPDLLARIDASRRREATETDNRLYAAVPRRHTDRRPFREERLPFGIMARLEEAASTEGAVLTPLTTEQVPGVLELARRAEERYRQDPELRSELARWVAPTRDGETRGLSPEDLGPRPSDALAPVRQFDRTEDAPERPVAEFEQTPNLAVLSTLADLPADWLRAGQATQHVLLLATDLGLATSFLTHPLEADDLRAWVRDPRRFPGHPQVVLRLGHPADPS